MPSIPNQEWYESESNRLGISPRCKFTTAKRCPRYYQSIWLLGEAGITTKMSKRDADILHRRWEKTDLWPQIDEEFTKTSGAERVNSFTRFCPEVMFDIFGYFIEYLHFYIDALDKDLTIRRLASEGVDSEDPCYQFQNYVARHYSQCKIYSQLVNTEKEQNQIFELKPNIWGIGIDLRAFRKWLSKRKNV